MKTFTTLLFSITLCFAGVYDYPYLVHSKDNYEETIIDKQLMYNEFETIIRFEPIFFNPSTNIMTQESKVYLDEVKKVYEQYAHKTLFLSIIGHTDQVQTDIEKVNQSWWYPSYTNDLTQESSQKIALSYAQDTQKVLTDKGIPKNILIIQQRSGFDNLYSTEIEEGRNSNYRAMVSLYVKKDLSADSDGDGVIDIKDKCPMTPQGHNVDDKGCSTILNLTVHYNVNSHTLREDSFSQLQKVLKFMKENKQFKVLLYGHASNEGTHLKNQILSEKRALSIRKYLIDEGIVSSRIATYGKSSSEPLFSNKTEEGREKNRRVEIKLY